MVPPARYNYVRSNVAFILCVAIPPHTYEISSARSFRSMFINKLIHCQHLGCLKERTLIEHGLHVSDGNHLKIIPIPITNPNQFIQKQLGSPTLQKEWLRGWPAVCGVDQSDAERQVLLEFPGDSLSYKPSLVLLQCLLLELYLRQKQWKLAKCTLEDPGGPKTPSISSAVKDRKLFYMLQSQAANKNQLCTGF